jgi:hypothetical protein
MLTEWRLPLLFLKGELVSSRPRSLQFYARLRRQSGKQSSQVT